jgi:dipeptide/tripeptide permease
MKRLLTVMFGAILILIGIILLFLPGPGILLIIAGGAILWRGLRKPRKPTGNVGGTPPAHRTE